MLIVGKIPNNYPTSQSINKCEKIQTDIVCMRCKKDVNERR